MHHRARNQPRRQIAMAKMRELMEKHKAASLLAPLFAARRQKNDLPAHACGRGAEPCGNSQLWQALPAELIRAVAQRTQPGVVAQRNRLPQQCLQPDKADRFAREENRASDKINAEQPTIRPRARRAQKQHELIPALHIESGHRERVTVAQ